MKLIKENKWIVIALGIIIVLLVVYFLVSMANDKKESSSKELDNRKVSDLVQETKGNIDEDSGAIVKSNVERHRYYEKRFYDAERKVMDNKNIDKEIDAIKDTIERESKATFIFENKENVMSGYLSALISLSELNENTKKNDTENNKMLIESINDNLTYSQREGLKAEVKTKKAVEEEMSKKNDE